MIFAPKFRKNKPIIKHYNNKLKHKMAYWMIGKMRIKNIVIVLPDWIIRLVRLCRSCREWRRRLGGSIMCVMMLRIRLGKLSKVRMRWILSIPPNLGGWRMLMIIWKKPEPKKIWLIRLFLKLLLPLPMLYLLLLLRVLVSLQLEPPQVITHQEVPFCHNQPQQQSLLPLTQSSLVTSTTT